MDLRTYRKERGLTLAELADQIGVTEVSLSRYERGRIPRPAILAKIREVTGGAVTPNDFHQAA